MFYCNNGESRIPSLILPLLFLCSALTGQKVDFRGDSLLTVKLMESNDYQLAVHVLDSITNTEKALLHQKNLTVLFMRERMAYAFDRLRMEETALELAKAVITDAESVGNYTSSIEARLTVALIHEKHGLDSHCAQELLRIRKLLAQHPRPASLARYYVRKASYQRIYQNMDSLGYYAELAIKAGQKADHIEAIGDGAFLYSIAYRDDKEAVYAKMEEAIRYSKEKESLNLYVALLVNLSEIKLHYGDREEAILLNERLVQELGEEFTSKYKDDAFLNIVYERRAKFLAVQDNYREAYLAMSRSHSAQIDFYENRLRQQVREVEAKYDFQQKDEEIALRDQEVARQTAQKRWVFYGLLATLGLILLLTRQTLQLRNVRQSLLRKANELSVVNGNLQESVAEQVMLRAELHHRVKNNLQVIISLLELQENRVTDIGTKSSLRSTSERVYSIAAVHELLSPQQRYDRIVFKNYLDKLCGHAAQMWSTGMKPVLGIDVAPYSFNIDTLIPLGVMISELLTNSRKNFADSDLPPIIGIRLRLREDGRFALRYRDNGPGYPSGNLQERKGGLGTYLIRSMSRQLQGAVNTYNDKGAVTEIIFDCCEERGVTQNSFVATQNNRGKNVSSKRSEMVN